MPELVPPTAAVHWSFLAGERAACAELGIRPDWLVEAEEDFVTFVAWRGEVHEAWGVPTTELWYVEGSVYIGTVVIRHELTPELLREGGHIGYNVVPAYRRHGHATAMLGAACAQCRALGLGRVLVTCDESNAGSRRVIEANGGRFEGVQDGIRHYWIDLSAS